MRYPEGAEEEWKEPTVRVGISGPKRGDSENDEMEEEKYKRGGGRTPYPETLSHVGDSNDRRFPKAGLGQPFRPLTASAFLCLTLPD